MEYIYAIEKKDVGKVWDDRWPWDHFEAVFWNTKDKQFNRLPQELKTHLGPIVVGTCLEWMERSVTLKHDRIVILKCTHAKRNWIWQNNS